jgi:hypothetical protein
MTQLTTGKYVKRETATNIRERRQFRPVIVTLHPGFMDLRLKGCRRSFTLGYEAAYRAAVMAEHEAKRQERIKRRRARRINA